MKSTRTKLLHSLAFRLSCYIALAVSIIFIIVSTIIYHDVQYAMKLEAKLRAQNSSNTIVANINAIVDQAETAVVNLEWVVEEYYYNKTLQDSLCLIPYYMVHDNKWIGGSVVCFPPKTIPKFGNLYAPLSYRDSTGKIVNTKLNYDYTSKEWYKIPMETGKDTWNEPFYGEGSDLMMTSFVRVLRDNKTHEIYSLLIADVILNDLQNMIRKALPYNNSFAFLISREGRFIVHPEKKFVLSRKIDSVEFNEKEKANDTIGEMMMKGKAGESSYTLDNQTYSVFYCPVESTGWSLAIVIPHTEIFKDVNSVVNNVTKVFIIGIILLLLFSSSVIYIAIRPLHNFAEAITKVGNGNFDITLPAVNHKDELNVLHDSFGKMQSSLKRIMAQLTETTKAQERVESELNIARQIQQDLLSKAFSPYVDWPNLQLYAFLQPAREVGGDLYDFFIRDRKLFFTIGDVSGKGIPASLVMAITRALFRIIAYSENSPSVIATRINNTIAAENKENMFVTMLFGVVDLQTGVLTYCNAGHNPPVHILDNSNVEFLKMVPNLPIGVLEDFEYAETKYQMEKNELFLLYTDGVTEAENTYKELFGDDALLNTVRKYASQSSKELVNSIYESVFSYTSGNEQSDDITLLSFRLEEIISVNQDNKQ